MAINFPDSPSNGDIHTVSGKQWQYVSTDTKWIAYGASLAPDVLKVDSGNNRVGINQTSPAYGLDVTGTARVTGVITASGGVTGTASVATEATNVTASANNSTDETVYPTFVDGATGTQGIETDTGLTYNPSTGVLTSTGFTGAVIGNVTGNASGTALTVTQAAQSAITSVGTLTGLTMGGELAAVDQVISRPVMKDYAETKVAMGANAVDLSLGNVQTYTLSGNQTLTFTNPPASGSAGSFTLIVTNGGSATLTWPTSVDWAGGTAPTLTSSGVDVLTFLTVDGGSIWYGFAAGLAMA